MTNEAWLATPWTTGQQVAPSSGPPEPLAFVVTDVNGVIKDMNDVFVHWSRFTRQRLLSAPHSLLRHPQMPAGLFKLVWDRLKTGQPVCAYLQNLPADGNTYTALVTMSPTTSGYLSVQQRPCRPEAAQAITKLYSSVRAAEFEAVDDGAAPETVPLRGADLLVDLLRQLGFSSYDDFMWTALPQEVDEYYRRTPSYLGPVIDDGTPVAAIMSASQDLARELLPWSQQQAELLRTWGTLSKTLVSLSPMMDEAKQAADKISQEIAQEAEFKAMNLSITVWASMIAEIEKVITDLPNDLLALRQACAQTRFWIGLAQIHTQMVRQYAVDAADPDTMAQSRQAISRLCVTLDRDFDDLSWRMEKNARFAATVAARIQSLHDLLAMPAQLIVNWKTMTQGSSDATVTRLLPQIDHQLNLAADTLDLLQTLADQCQTIAVVQPMDVAHRCVQRIQQALGVAPESQVLHVAPDSPATGNNTWPGHGFTADPVVPPPAQLREPMPSMVPVMASDGFGFGNEPDAYPMPQPTMAMSQAEIFASLGLDPSGQPLSAGQPNFGGPPVPAGSPEAGPQAGPRADFAPLPPAGQMTAPIPAPIAAPASIPQPVSPAPAYGGGSLDPQSFSAGPATAPAQPQSAQPFPAGPATAPATWSELVMSTPGGVPATYPVPSAAPGQPPAGYDPAQADNPTEPDIYATLTMMRMPQAYASLRDDQPTEPPR